MPTNTTSWWQATFNGKVEHFWIGKTQGFNITKVVSACGLYNTCDIDYWKTKQLPHCKRCERSKRKKIIEVKQEIKR
jgi:hypothetical protein